MNLTIMYISAEASNLKEEMYDLFNNIIDTS